MNTQTTGEASVGNLRLWIAAQRAEAHSYLEAVMAVPNHARTDEQETWAANMTGRLSMLQQMSTILAGAVGVREREDGTVTTVEAMEGCRLVAEEMRLYGSRDGDHAGAPEMGQMLFGQPRQEYECTAEVVTFLRLLGEAVPCNNSPCDNTGERYENAVFALHAYSWDDDVPQRHNFRWRDVEVSWYKYLGRGTTVNRVLTSEKMEQMSAECLASVGLDVNGNAAHQAATIGGDGDEQ